MKSILIGFALLGGLSAGAATAPVYLSHLKGTVLTSLVQRETFEFNPGTLSDCQQTVSDDSLAIYECSVSGASVQVGSGMQAAFDKAWIAFASTPKTTTHEYRFSADWREGSSTGLKSSLVLDLSYDVAAPSDIQGTVGLSAYGVSGGIQASPVK
jgi:hypothetical protein